MKATVPPVPVLLQRDFARAPMGSVHNRPLSLDYSKAAPAHSPAATRTRPDDRGKVFVPDSNLSAEPLEIALAQYFPQSNSD